MTRQQTSSPGPRSRGQYAPINGIQLYHEIHGNGPPLVLVHGGGSTIETTFGRILPLLAKRHRVIAVEMQAHGRTRDIDRAMTFEQDADDLAALLRHLHIAKADFFGFSNGGTTALQVGIRHPGIVNRLVIASANYRRDGMMPGFWDSMSNAKFSDMPQAYKDAYLNVTPDPDGLLAMFTRDATRMQGFTDIPDAAIRSIDAPTFVVDGDRDVVVPEHAVALSRLLPDARLCILPGGHGEYFGELMFAHVGDDVPPRFVSIVEEFLLPPG